MHEVSGVTGAGPILHGIFDHLHATRGTSWYRTPPQIVERSVHPLSGKLLPHEDPRGCSRRFVADNVAPAESPGDYDADGHVQLPRSMAIGLRARRIACATKRLGGAMDRNCESHLLWQVRITLWTRMCRRAIEFHSRRWAASSWFDKVIPSAASNAMDTITHLPFKAIIASP